MNRARLLFVASALALVGVVSAASGYFSAEPDARVQLSTRQHASAPQDDDALPDLFVPTDDESTTTSTTQPVTTSSTVAHETTTTTAAPNTPTTVALATTSTTVPPTTATVRVKNTFPVAVRVTVGDDNENAWTLEPGESAGPWTLNTSDEHGDYITVQVVETDCGFGDSADFFKGGHAYLLEVYARNAECGSGHVVTPAIRVFDTFNGNTSKWCINDGCLPTTG